MWVGQDWGLVSSRWLFRLCQAQGTQISGWALNTRVEGHSIKSLPFQPSTQEGPRLPRMARTVAGPQEWECRLMVGQNSRTCVVELK